jgi:hypothetical protein
MMPKEIRLAISIEVPNSDHPPVGILHGMDKLLFNVVPAVHGPGVGLPRTNVGPEYVVASILGNCPMGTTKKGREMAGWKLFACQPKTAPPLGDCTGPALPRCREALLSPGGPAAIFLPACAGRNVGQWLCVPPFRMVYLFQGGYLSTIFYNLIRYAHVDHPSQARNVPTSEVE